MANWSSLNAPGTQTPWSHPFLKLSEFPFTSISSRGEWGRNPRKGRDQILPSGNLGGEREELVDNDRSKRHFAASAAFRAMAESYTEAHASVQSTF